MIELKEANSFTTSQPNILVIGVGGAGNNAINRLLKYSEYPVSYIAVNTDIHVLNESLATQRIQIGAKLTKGFGAGGNLEIGKAAAEENEEQLKALLDDIDMVILTCGMGGGTGTGATPVIARLCQEAGILTLAIVTRPFSFESLPRVTQADTGIRALQEHVDMLITIHNDKLLTITDKKFMLDDAFLEADSVLTHAINGITNIIFRQGTVNLDFNDLRSTLTKCGIGYFGIGSSPKEDSLMEAMQKAIHSPLVDCDISSASRILINTSGNIDLNELNEAIQYIQTIVSPAASIMWGTVNNGDDNDHITVTFIAAGLEEAPKVAKSPTPFPITPDIIAPPREDQGIDIPIFLRKQKYWDK